MKVDVVERQKYVEVVEVLKRAQIVEKMCKLIFGEVVAIFPNMPLFDHETHTILVTTLLRYPKKF